jgi:glycosyltransferase involved in cell wall biosynthesis
MACGTPVVSSDLPPVREFARGVIRVDGNDPDAIAAGLGEALARRDELGRRGRQAARDYDWKRVARETAAVYREVAA